MSEDYIISLYVDPEDQAEAFERLAKRLAQRAYDISVEVLLVSKEPQTFSFSELPEIIQKIAPRLSEVERIEISYGARHRSGRKIVYYLVWNGTSSLPVINNNTQFNAPFKVDIDIQQLCIREERFQAQPLTIVPVREFKGLQLPEAMLFFLDTCGVFVPSETAIRHAALTVVAGLRVAEQTPILYHRDVHQFAYDLVRTLFYVQWGIRLSALLRYTGDLFQLDEKAIKETWNALPLSELYKNRDRFLEDVHAPYTKAAHEYRMRLTPKCIQQVLMLPTERIRALIVETCQKEQDLVCYDFGERGLVVAFNLEAYMWLGRRGYISSLYKIYNRLLDEVGA